MFNTERDDLIRTSRDGTDGIGVAGKLLDGPSLDHETVFSLSQSAKQVAW